MKCKSIQSMLAAFAANDLPDADKANVAAHLEHCEKCRQEHQLLQQSWDILDDFTVPELNSNFTSNVLRRVQQEQNQQLNQSLSFLEWLQNLGGLRLAAGSAFAVLLLLIIGIAWQQSNTPEKNLPIQVANLPAEEDLIRNLEIYEKLEVLENLQLLSDLEVLEQLNEQEL